MMPIPKESEERLWVYFVFPEKKEATLSPVFDDKSAEHEAFAAIQPLKGISPGVCFARRFISVHTVTRSSWSFHSTCRGTPYTFRTSVSMPVGTFMPFQGQRNHGGVRVARSKVCVCSLDFKPRLKSSSAVLLCDRWSAGHSGSRWKMTTATRWTVAIAVGSHGEFSSNITPFFRPGCWIVIPDIS